MKFWSLIVLSFFRFLSIYFFNTNWDCDYFYFFFVLLYYCLLLLLLFFHLFSVSLFYDNIVFYLHFVNFYLMFFFFYQGSFNWKFIYWWPIFAWYFVSFTVFCSNARCKIIIHIHILCMLFIFVSLQNFVAIVLFLVIDAFICNWLIDVDCCTVVVNFIAIVVTVFILLFVFSFFFLFCLLETDWF